MGAHHHRTVVQIYRRTIQTIVCLSKLIVWFDIRQVQCGTGTLDKFQTFCGRHFQNVCPQITLSQRTRLWRHVKNLYTLVYSSQPSRF